MTQEEGDKELDTESEKGYPSEELEELRSSIYSPDANPTMAEIKTELEDIAEALNHLSRLMEWDWRRVEVTKALVHLDQAVGNWEAIQKIKDQLEEKGLGTQTQTPLTEIPDVFKRLFGVDNEEGH